MSEKLYFEERLADYRRTGDDAVRQELFKSVYDAYFKLVWFCAYSLLGNKEDTDEISDDVFIAFYNRMDKTEIANVKYYLTRSARNLSLNRLRDRKTVEELNENLAYEHTYCEGSGAMEAIRAKTTKEEFSLLCLHILEGYSLVEIAEKRHTSVNTLKSQYRRLVGRLKKELGGFNDE